MQSEAEMLSSLQENLVSNFESSGKQMLGAKFSCKKFIGEDFQCNTWKYKTPKTVYFPALLCVFRGEVGL